MNVGKKFAQKQKEVKQTLRRKHTLKLCGRDWELQSIWVTLGCSLVRPWPHASLLRDGKIIDDMAGRLPQKGIISKFLDCGFHVNPEATVMKLLEAIKQHVFPTKMVYSRDVPVPHHPHGQRRTKPPERRNHPKFCWTFYVGQDVGSSSVQFQKARALQVLTCSGT